MERMRNKFKYISVLFFIVMLVGACRENQEEEMPDILSNIDSIKVLKGTKDMDPAKRILTEIGELDKEGQDLLLTFIKESRTNKLSYVLSPYYLQIISKSGKSKTLGVLVKSDGSLIGLDITGMGSMGLKSSASVRYNNSLVLVSASNTYMPSQ